MGILTAASALFFKNDPIGAWQEAEEQQAQRGERPPTFKGTVLAIDDDPSFLEAIRGLLSAEGFNVLTSSTGPKGLDMVRYAGGDIDVVLLDFNMPKFDGASTLSFLRKLAPNAKVFAVTGIDDGLIPASFRDGVDRLIKKPFRNIELVESINSVLASNAQVSSHVVA